MTKEKPSPKPERKPEDDLFIREVDQKLREDRASELWEKYGSLIIGGAVAIVLGTAALVGYGYYAEQQLAARGDRFMDAVALAEADNGDAAKEALEAIAQDGEGGYPALARLRLAAEQAAAGDKQAAIGTYAEIVSSSSAPAELKDLARLQAGLLAVDTEAYSDVEARLSGLAAAGSPMRHSAREALAIAAIKAEDLEKALEWLVLIRDDAEAPQGIAGRANLMLDFLAGRGIAPAQS